MALVNSSKRHFMWYGKSYMTGFDRMLYDKLSWTKIYGNWFAILGFANIAAYALSLYLPKRDYIYHFAFTTYPSRVFKFLKSIAGCDNIVNLAISAPPLILLNTYLQSKLGALFMTKFFFISFASTYMFWAAFNPDSKLQHALLRPYMPKIDSWAKDGSYYMGSDQLVKSLIYFTMLYHRLYFVAIPTIVFDLLWFGPAAGGAPAAAMFGALALL